VFFRHFQRPSFTTMHNNTHIVVVFILTFMILASRRTDKGYRTELLRVFLFSFSHFFNSITDDMCLDDFYWWMMPAFLPPPRTVARKNFFLPFRYVCCLELDTLVQRVAVCVRRSLGGHTRKKDKKFSSCKQRRHGEILKLWVSCH